MSESRPRLEPEHLELLRDMVEAVKNADRSERSFCLLPVDDPKDVLDGPPGFRRMIIANDVYDLAAAGMLTQRGDSPPEFTIPEKGFQAVTEAVLDDPATTVEEELAHRFIEADAFREAYPASYTRWQEAAALLWGPKADTELSTIGHKTREALQEFANTLVEQNRPPDVDPDPAHTVNRLRSVIDLHHDRLGEKRHELLIALVDYWKAATALVSRQAHAVTKEGRPLTWEDGRRAVFQTLLSCTKSTGPWRPTSRPRQPPKNEHAHGSPGDRGVPISRQRGSGEPARQIRGRYSESPTASRASAWVA